MVESVRTEKIEEGEQWGGSTEFLPERASETAAATVAAQAAAQIQARYAIAIRQKRSVDQARAVLLSECRRPAFAESATYEKPVGTKSVRGFSIRFAEAASRALGNMQSDTITVYDDLDKRILRVTVTDLESNASWAKDVSVNKTVERRELRRGQVPIARRTNSTGQIVYIVAATEDDLLTKENALVSKTLRTLLLRMVPGDIIEDCEREVTKTLNDRAAKDPDAERKRIIDSFAALGVFPDDLEAYLGHELARVVPAELVRLRKTYAAIREGEATWIDVMEQVRAERPAPSPAGQPAGATRETLAGVAKAAVAARSDPPKGSEDNDEKIAAAAFDSAPPAPAAAVENPKKQAPEKSLDMVAAEAKACINDRLFLGILKGHGADRGKLGFGLGSDGQAALKAALVLAISQARLPDGFDPKASAFGDSAPL